jgi:TPP-dependent trihydroxycyclohexane-1,2-dione (THcHDO) dehydratase
VGFTNQLIATCTYSDSSTTNCTTTDAHGNVASTYASSNTGHATVGTSTGLVTAVGAGSTNLTAQAGTFTSPNLPLAVLAIPSGTYTITITGPVTFSGTVSF